MARKSTPIHVDYLEEKILLKLKVDRLRVTLFRCPGCDSWYVTRGKSRTCSNKCRVRVYRKRHQGQSTRLDSASTVIIP
jgi:hypothetical protein